MPVYVHGLIANPVSLSQVRATVRREWAARAAGEAGSHG
jgi:hypothetical protein